MKKLFTTLLTIIMVMGIMCQNSFAAVNKIDSTELTKNSSNQKNVLIIILGNDKNEHEVVIGCEPVNDNGKVFLPLDELMVSTDYYYVSNSDSDIIITNGNREISMKYKEKSAIVDEKMVELKNEILLAGEKKLLNIEDVELLFSYDVSYDDKNNNVVLAVTEKTPQAIKNITPPSMSDNKNIPHSVKVFSGSDELKIKIDDELVIFPDAKPFIDNENRTQVPVRALAEMLKCQVLWNQENQEVTIITLDNEIITTNIGDRKLFKDGQIIEMDTTAVVINSRTYLPLRFLSEALGLTVIWKYTE